MKTKFIFPALIILIGFGQNLNAQSSEKLINLKGTWKFSIGDNIDWSKPGYDDRDWENIKVPSSWEDEGYNGYDGYAWYRKHVRVSSSYKGRSFGLNLGQIDDVDQVFFNGHMIGASGIFPPNYSSAYYVKRLYYLPERYLNFDEDNVIAVRVYDSQMVGGMTKGDIGIFEEINFLRLDVDLSGLWKFKTGDNLEWKERIFDDKNWDKIIVPNYWEAQGYSGYDGFTWYRINFTLPDNLSNKKLILIMGKIDDLDETYINGTLVGATGDINGNKNIDFVKLGAYNKIRGYYIPDGIIQANKENTIAVRVYDGYRDGGIYNSPVGIVTQEKYIQYWKNQKSKSKNKSFWDWFFD